MMPPGAPAPYGMPQPPQAIVPPPAAAPVVPPQTYMPQPVAPVAPAPQAYTPPAPQPDSYVSETVMQGADSTVIVGARSAGSAYLNVTNYPVDVGENGRVLIDSFPFVVGRSEGNLVVSAPSVSRRHCQISFDPNSRTYYITDLNSSNGTTLNGQRLTPMQPTQVSNGATINVGPHVTIRFEIG